MSSASHSGAVGGTTTVDKVKERCLLCGAGMDESFALYLTGVKNPMLFSYCGWDHFLKSVCVSDSISHSDSSSFARHEKWNRLLLERHKDVLTGHIL